MVFAWLACQASVSELDSGMEEVAQLEPSFEAQENCPLTAEPASLFFGSHYAMADAVELSLTLLHDCPQPHSFLTAPESWIDEEVFSMVMPGSTLIQSGDSLRVSFTPKWTQTHEGTLRIPYTHTETPLEIPLHAEVREPLPMLLVGGQQRRVLSFDYGKNVASETQQPGPESKQSGVCYGNNSFLVVGGTSEGKIWRSIDAESWQVVDWEGELMAMGFSSLMRKGYFTLLRA